jgi:hypothetical protein
VAVATSITSDLWSYFVAPPIRAAIVAVSCVVSECRSLLRRAGVSALAKVGLDKEIRECGIPMYGRMLHAVDGHLTFQPYGLPHQYNLSVSRQVLSVAGRCRYCDNERTN